VDGPDISSILLKAKKDKPILWINSDSRVRSAMASAFSVRAGSHKEISW